MPDEEQMPDVVSRKTSLYVKILLTWKTDGTSRRIDDLWEAQVQSKGRNAEDMVLESRPTKRAGRIDISLKWRATLNQVGCACLEKIFELGFLTNIAIMAVLHWIRYQGAYPTDLFPAIAMVTTRKCP